MNGIMVDTDVINALSYEGTRERFQHFINSGCTTVSVPETFNYDLVCRLH